LIISIFSEIIQGDECANIAKRRKLDNEHENISINVDTVGKRSINNVSKDRKTEFFLSQNVALSLSIIFRKFSSFFFFSLYLFFFLSVFLSLLLLLIELSRHFG
jgi:hypothetical protein